MATGGVNPMWWCMALVACWLVACVWAWWLVCKVGLSYYDDVQSDPMCKELGWRVLA